MSSLTTYAEDQNDELIQTKRMQWLLNAPTRSKLLFGFGMMLLFLLGAIISTYFSFTSIQNTYHNLYSQELSFALELKTMRANQNGIRANLLALLLLDSTSEQQDRLRQDIQSRTDENTALMVGLLARTQDVPALRAQLEDLEDLQNAFRDTREREILPQFDDGTEDEARLLVLGIQEERSQQMRVITDALIEEIDMRAEAALVDAEQRATTLLTIFVVVGILALITGVVLALSLERIIANPLRTISRVAERVSSGDLTVNVPPWQRTDEVGILAQVFRHMVNALRELNREVSEGVGVLSGSTGEIVAATSQLAAGMAETAASVSQTTTTVEEVRQGAEVASQKAKYVLDSAQKSLQVAQTGKASVAETIQGMQRIQGQMELIADSIVRLSEQSQAIGEITASVTDLADQSNLLAVNAAIEAAKAGEHGRGFAVVAQEVRSLAEQSKQATAQVRTILGDVQKATSSAVMATEQGSKSVEAGVTQSNATGAAIGVLSDTIAEAAQAATQIAASSQQQLVGMSQVAQAMENINQAGAQNAASTRQAETIAQDLHKLGQRLKHLVEQYQI